MLGSPKGFLLFFTLFWTLIVGLFDVVMMTDGLRRLSSLRYQSVPCVITKAEVREDHDGEGSSYYPEITYTYAVDGQKYEGDQLYAGSRHGSSSRRAHRIISTYAAGTETNAWIDPAAPANAVLRRGLLGNELFLALFMTPFNVAMIGLWAALFHLWRTAKHTVIAGGVELIDTPNGICARLSRYSPLIAGALGLGVSSFVSVFVVAFTFGEFARPAVMVPVWVIVIGIGLSAYAWRRQQEISGREDLILHADGLRLTLPQHDDRKTSITLDITAVKAVTVEEVWPVNRDSESHPMFAPTLETHDGRRFTLVKWHEQSKATGFADWLREKLFSAPPVKPPTAKV
jgi:hypothetical protein